MFWLENHARFSGVINFLGDMNIRSRVSEHRRGLPDSRVFRRRNLASCSEKQQEPRRNAHEAVFCNVRRVRARGPKNLPPLRTRSEYLELTEWSVPVDKQWSMIGNSGTCLNGSLMNWYVTNPRPASTTCWMTQFGVVLLKR